MDVEWFLGVASELLAVPSTVDRPAELERALGFVLDFVGTDGFTVERFVSGGKPSALAYRSEHAKGAERPRFRIILNAHLDVVPRRWASSSRAGMGRGCTRAAPRT